MARKADKTYTFTEFWYDCGVNILLTILGIYLLTILTRFFIDRIIPLIPVSRTPDLIKSFFHKIYSDMNFFFFTSLSIIFLQFILFVPWLTKAGYTCQGRTSFAGYSPIFIPVDKCSYIDQKTLFYQTFILVFIAAISFFLIKYKKGFQQKD